MIQKSIYLMESYLKGTRLFENDIKEYALKFQQKNEKGYKEKKNMVDINNE